MKAKLSTDGGQHYQFLRLTNVPVAISVASSGSGSNGMYETEMTGLSVSGSNGLPGGIRIRESPSRRSAGGTQIDGQSDGTSLQYAALPKPVQDLALTNLKTIQAGGKTVLG